MAPKFGKASSATKRSKKPLQNSGHFALSATDRSRSLSKPSLSPLSQLYEQKPFGFSPSSPRTLLQSQAVAGLREDVRLQEMSSYVTSRGGSSLPVLTPEVPIAAADPTFRKSYSSSRGFKGRSEDVLAGLPPSYAQHMNQTHLSQHETFGSLPDLPGYSFRSTTGEFAPLRGTQGGASRATATRGERTGVHWREIEDERSTHESESEQHRAPSRPSTRETAAGLRAEGLETSEQQSRRLARRTPEHSLEEAEGLGARRARTPPLPKNLSMPNLHERHDTEAAKGYDRQVDRWLRRLMVDVNISHKSLPESSARSQICTHLEKVHGWFDRSKKASTFLKQSAGCEKPPVPSKQVTNYLPMDHPVPPGSMYWERPEKLIPKPKGEEDMEATSANDATTDLESSVDTLLDVLDL
ncbi:unnamed protein product [Durusdinium trenchii]|uniref:Uncharacterized protein n=1 Tax=Durusdinium trenchii TaxID=1381693 RepID=A0ABP0J4L8_9DINO